MFEGTRLELAIPSCSVSESIDSLVEENVLLESSPQAILRALPKLLYQCLCNLIALLRDGSFGDSIKAIDSQHQKPRFAAPNSMKTSTTDKCNKMSRLTKQKKYTLGSNGYITIYVRLHRLRLDSLLEFS